MIKNNRPKMILYSVFTCLLILLVISFLVEKKSIEPNGIFYNSDGKVVMPPFTPSFEHPLGTDENGTDLLMKLVTGFKYTFIFSIGITFLRIVLAVLCSLLILFFLKPLKAYIESFLTPFLYVPAFIIILFLVNQKKADLIVATHGEIFLIIYQIVIICLVGIPPLILLLMEEFEQLIKKDYITASRLLGASNFHLVRKQLFPIFKSRFFIVFIQQSISTIILLIYLGIFQIYIGGKANGGIIGDTKKYLSKSNEWGGMIGQSIFDMVHYPWIIFCPVIAVICLIISLNIIIKQLEKISKNNIKQG